MVGAVGSYALYLKLQVKVWISVPASVLITSQYLWANSPAADRLVCCQVAAGSKLCLCSTEHAQEGAFPGSSFLAKLK